MGFIEAVFAVGHFFIQTVQIAAQIDTIRSKVKQFIRQVVKDELTTQGANPSTQKTTSERVQNDLEVIDAEFTELEQKCQRDGTISSYERDRLEELSIRREDKFGQWQKTKTLEVMAEEAANPDAFETSVLNDDKAHVLQFHMGQVVLEKRCHCGRSMFLQHKNRPDGSLFQLRDFFWSCTGFYNKEPIKCKGSQWFQVQDIGLLHKAGVFELQLSRSDLHTIWQETSIQRATLSRVKNHLKEKDGDVLCPIHHVPMVLREKLKHSGVALDMFYLGCPHFSCGQTVKLKSAAQLAAFLHRKEGRGIL